MYASACTKPKKVECREYDFPSVSMFLILESGTVPKVYLANIQAEVVYFKSCAGSLFIVMAVFNLKPSILGVFFGHYIVFFFCHYIVFSSSIYGF